MMNGKRMKAWLLVGLLLLSLIMSGCAPGSVTGAQGTEPSSSLESTNPSQETTEPTEEPLETRPSEGSPFFYEDRVVVGLKPGFGGINKEIDLSLFASTGIILESNINEDTDLTGKIVITSVIDSSYKEKPELYNPETFVQRLYFYLRDASKENVLELVDRMKRLECVDFAEPKYIMDAIDQTVMYSANDEYEGEQWGLSEVGANVLEAWELVGDGGTTPTIRVGIFETGMQMDHPDLQTTSGYFIPSATAAQEHGTHVAGIIGAIANNEIGIAGVAQVEIVLLDRNHFVESLEWAAENGVRIINASFCFGY